MKTNDLGRGEKNESNFDSLSQIQVLNAEQAQDAIRVIDQAIEEVSSDRGRMGAFQKNNLESNLNYLRIAHEIVEINKKRPRPDMPGFLPADYFEWVVLKNEIMSLPFKIFQQSRKPEAEKEAELLDISDFCSDKIRKLENILKIVRKTIGDTDDIVVCISEIVEFTHHDASKSGFEIMDVMKSYRLKEPSKPLESRYGELERYFKHNYSQLFRQGSHPE